MKVLFRTDASPAIGTGHVMRCIALAQAVKDAGHDVLFASAMITSGIEARLRKERLSLKKISAQQYGDDDAKETAQLAKEIEMDWIVVDGYGFGREYQDRLKKEGLRVLFMDDYGHAESYSADLVLNQNVSAREEWYRERTSGVKLLLGPQFAMLRREFRERKDGRTARKGPVQHLIVTFGGADIQNVTGRALKAIEMAGYSGIVSAIIGKSNVNAEALRTQAAESKSDIRIIEDADMPTMLMDADMAVCAAGTTSWELLYMGVPFVTGAFAENQIAVAESLAAQGLSATAGWYPELSEQKLAAHIKALIADEERRTTFSRKGIDTVDGDGVLRVLAAMSGASAKTAAPPLKLREATKDDVRLMHAWANDPMTRQSSFSPDPIPWEDHQRWIEGKLLSKDSVIFIGMDGDRPVGQIRFDIRDDGDAEVDIHLAPDARGKGYGSLLIQEGLKRFFATTKTKTVHAFAKTDNDASRKAFLKAGFIEQGTEKIKGHDVYHLVFTRS